MCTRMALLIPVRKCRVVWVSRTIRRFMGPNRVRPNRGLLGLAVTTLVSLINCATLTSKLVRAPSEWARLRVKSALGCRCKCLT